MLNYITSKLKTICGYNFIVHAPLLLSVNVKIIFKREEFLKFTSVSLSACYAFSKTLQTNICILITAFVSLQLLDSPDLLSH